MKYPLLCLLFILNTSLSSGQTKVFTEDIDHFWTAYDSVQHTTDTLKQLSFIQTLYLDKASPGLKEFMTARQHSAKRHLYNIRRYPKFWPSLRPYTLNIRSHIPEMNEVMKRFKALYPSFRTPEVYFTIGVLNSGGTTTEDKVLIGAEIAAPDSHVNASELGPWLQSMIRDNKNVVYLVAHEIVHTQQKTTEPEGEEPTLLGYCISEGSGDFIAEQLLQQPLIASYLTYGKTHEQMLWEAFQKEMYGTEFGAWLYNGDQAPNGQADLGYFIGYTICKSYYQQAKNKQAALKEIIELDYSRKSLEIFLERSGYKGSLYH